MHRHALPKLLLGEREGRGGGSAGELFGAATARSSNAGGVGESSIQREERHIGVNVEPLKMQAATEILRAVARTHHLEGHRRKWHADQKTVKPSVR